jgi:hypothetical protein
VQETEPHFLPVSSGCCGLRFKPFPMGSGATCFGASTLTTYSFQQQRLQLSGCHDGNSSWVWIFFFRFVSLFDFLFCPFSLLFTALWSWKVPFQWYWQHFGTGSCHVNVTGIIFELEQYDYSFSMEFVLELFMEHGSLQLGLSRVGISVSLRFLFGLANFFYERWF